MLARFKSLVGGKTRDTRSGKNEESKLADQEIKEKNRRLKKLREQVAKRDRELAELRARLSGISVGAEPSGIKSENIVWVFGPGRTGSSWLTAIMGDLPSHQVWFEPQLGELFDRERLKVGTLKGRHESFVLAPQHEKSWLRSINNFVLEGAHSRFTEGADVLVIKETHGSAGAPLLVRALPESRMILLVRDPRDALASALDAFLRGMWRDGWRGMYAGPDETPDAFIEGAARSYLRHLTGAKKAYEAHEGPKVLLCYEDLVADTFGAIGRLYSELGIAVDGAKLARAVEKHSWENIPEEKKGEGKFYRKATPGAWREDLTKEQIAVVEQITEPIIKEFYGS